MMFTRTITTFEVTAVKLSFVGGEAKADVIGRTTYFGTAASKNEARKALKAAGYDIPRGTEINIEKLEEVTYGCTIDKFMEVAQPIERVNHQAADGE